MDRADNDKIILLTDQIRGDDNSASAALEAAGISYYPYKKDWLSQSGTILIGPMKDRSVMNFCLETAWRNGKMTGLYKQFYPEPELRYFERIQSICSYQSSPGDLERHFERAREELALESSRYNFWASEFNSDYNYYQNLIAMSDFLIYSSEFEKNRFAAWGFDTGGNVVALGWPASTCIFRETKTDGIAELDNFILCIAPLEPRNNQALLALAAKALNKPVVFIGDWQDRQYANLVRNLSGGLGIFYEEAGEELLIQAFKSADVFCLPTLDGSLNRFALMAGANGVPLLFPSESSAPEYFKHYASYFSNPSLISLIDAIADLPQGGHSLNHLDGETLLEANVEYEYWQNVSDAVHDYVESAPLSDERHDVSFRDASLIYMDITPVVNERNAFTGIPRYVLECTRNMLDIYGDRMRLLYYDRDKGYYLDVKKEDFLAEEPRMRGGELGGLKPGKMAELETDGILLITGNNHLNNRQFNAYLAGIAKFYSLYVIGAVHDSIPALFPHWYYFAPRNRTFLLLQTLQILSRVLTISQSSAKDIYRLAADNLVAAPPITISRHGDIVVTNIRLGEEILPIKEKLGGQPFILLISGFEYRKNHILIYDVYRRLVEELGADKLPQLVLVGKKYEPLPVFDLIEHDALLRDKIILFENVNDAALHWLYKNCLFTVYPSLYEGWGLPVAESLAYGKACIASNISSIPEIAPDLVDLIDPLDGLAWKEQIKSYIIDLKKLKSREQEIAQLFKPVGWDKSVAALTSSLASCTLVRPKISILSLDTPANNSKVESNNPRLSKFAGSGWLSDLDGLFAIAEECSLIFRSRTDRQPVMLEIQGFSLLEADVYFRIEINGELRQLGRMRKQESVIRLWIPHENCDENGFSETRISFRLVFNVSRPTPNSEWQWLRVRQINLRIPDAEAKAIEAAVGNLQDLVPGWRSALRGLLAERGDLYPLLQEKLGNFRILLWAWQYGSGEDIRLASLENNILEILRELYNTRLANALVQGYNNLIDLIWQIRPDLKAIPNNTSAGQTSLLKWFAKQGIWDYNLRIDSEGSIVKESGDTPALVLDRLRAIAAKKSILPSQPEEWSAEEALEICGYSQPPNFGGKEPNLSRPVSQIATFSQTNSAIYSYRCADLAELRRQDRRQWERVFILQALLESGLAQPGSSGLGIYGTPDKIPSALATQRARIEILDDESLENPIEEMNEGETSRNEETALARYYSPEIIDAKSFARLVKLKDGRLADLGYEKRGCFDFIWSSCASQEKNVGEALLFMHEAMHFVRKGGVGVFTFDLVVSEIANAPITDFGCYFRKEDVERIGNDESIEMAPFNWCSGNESEDRRIGLGAGGDFLRQLEDGYIVTSMGVILRRI